MSTTRKAPSATSFTVAPRSEPAQRRKEPSTLMIVMACILGGALMVIHIAARIPQ